MPYFEVDIQVTTTYTTTIIADNVDAAFTAASDVDVSTLTPIQGKAVGVIEKVE